MREHATPPIVKQVNYIKRNVDRAMQSDRGFFARHPNRNYRVRRARPSEIIEMIGLTNRYPRPLSPSCRYYIAVRKQEPNEHAMLFYEAGGKARTDLNEEQARAIWDSLTGKRNDISDLVRLV